VSDWVKKNDLDELISARFWCCQRKVRLKISSRYRRNRNQIAEPLKRKYDDRLLLQSENGHEYSRGRNKECSLQEKGRLASKGHKLLHNIHWYLLRT
jgi:hypothetical protein